MSHLYIFFPCFFYAGTSVQQIETQPEFLAPLDNLTVSQGRDISFTCVVNDLGHYRVSNTHQFNAFMLIISTDQYNHFLDSFLFFYRFEFISKLKKEIS